MVRSDWCVFTTMVQVWLATDHLYSDMASGDVPTDTTEATNKAIVDERR